MISLSYQNTFVFALFFETSYNEVAAEHAAEHPITLQLGDCIAIFVTGR